AAAAPAGHVKTPLVLAAVAVLVLGAEVVWAVTRPAGGTAPGASAPIATAPVIPASAPTLDPLPTPPSPSAEDKLVQVAIRPEGATVEVEGEAATLMTGGYLELTGPPGKVFKVHVAKGPSQVDAEVIITESGAFPSILELKAGQKIKISHNDAPAPKP